MLFNSCNFLNMKGGIVCVIEDCPEVDPLLATLASPLYLTYFSTLFRLKDLDI